MTVGIAITNGREALAITDCRVSGGGRQSDSVDKMGHFDRPNFSGVIFGTGLGNQIEGILRNLDEFKGVDFDSYIAEMQTVFSREVDAYKSREVESRKKDIITKAALIVNDRERAEFIKKMTFDHLRDYDRAGQGAFFASVAYDRDKKKIRFLNFSLPNRYELFTKVQCIGSGSDGADLSLSTKLQGLDITKLSPEELAYFATNAYVISTMNQGVGGTPKLAKIAENGVTIYNQERAVALANISGAFSAEYCADLMPRITIDLFGEVMNERKPNYGAIARTLNLNKDSLTSICIPYSSWQERSNRRLFPSKKE